MEAIKNKAEEVAKKFDGNKQFALMYCEDMMAENYPHDKERFEFWEAVKDFIANKM